MQTQEKKERALIEVEELVQILRTETDLEKLAKGTFSLVRLLDVYGYLLSDEMREEGIIGVYERNDNYCSRLKEIKAFVEDLRGNILLARADTIEEKYNKAKALFYISPQVFSIPTTKEEFLGKI